MCLRRVATLAALLAAAAIAASCGARSRSPAVETHRSPANSAFPKSNGRSLGTVMHLAKSQGNLIVAPQSLVVYPGASRYSFAVFNAAQKQIANAKVAIYLAQAQGPALGPFPAHRESLVANQGFRSQTSANDPNALSGVYVATVRFPTNGEWRIGALIKRGKRVDATFLPSATVGEFTQVPRVGQRAPRIHTPTASSVGGHLPALTTRVPPDTMNKVDFYSVLGKKPIALLFATPRFSQARASSPIVDIAEQVQHEFQGKADFIHMEMFNNNRPSDGVRPEVRAFNLPSEPWLFVIDRAGVIRTVIEGAFSSAELSNAVKAVTGG